MRSPTAPAPTLPAVVSNPDTRPYTEGENHTDTSSTCAGVVKDIKNRYGETVRRNSGKVRQNERATSDALDMNPMRAKDILPPSLVARGPATILPNKLIDA